MRPVLDGITASIMFVYLQCIANMPPRRKSPRRPTRPTVSAQDAEYNDEQDLRHRDAKAPRVTLTTTMPLLPPPPPPGSSEVVTPDPSDISSLTPAPISDSESNIQPDVVTAQGPAGRSRNKRSKTFDWSWVDWNSLSGHSIPVARSVHMLNSKLWEFGVPTETKTGDRYWLCKQCHLDKVIGSHHFNCEEGSSSAIKHLRSVHKITWTKSGDIVPFTRRGLAPSLDLNLDIPREQSLMNQMALGFDAVHFQRLVMQWIIEDNLPFRQVETKAFHAMWAYAAPRAEVVLPTG